MPRLAFDVTRFFAIVVAGIAVLAAYGWYAGIPGAKELLMFLLGGIIGVVNPSPPRDVVEISVPANYRVTIKAEIAERQG